MPVTACRAEEISSPIHHGPRDDDGLDDCAADVCAADVSCAEDVSSHGSRCRDVVEEVSAGPFDGVSEEPSTELGFGNSVGMTMLGSERIGREMDGSEIVGRERVGSEMVGSEIVGRSIVGVGRPPVECWLSWLLALDG